MEKPMVELVKVSKIYPPDVVALENVSIYIEKGEMVFLTGKSGAGKTTLLKLICGIEQPDQGLIEVAGKDLSRIKPKDMPYLRQKTGMAYQDFKLLPDQTVAQNIAMPMQVVFRSIRSTKNRVSELLDKLKLESKHSTLASNLSRGEQQRVALARAIANLPPLILADEPTGNLDGATTKLVMALLEECKDAGSTIILATHDKAIYSGTAHRALEIRDGQLIPPKNY